MTDRQDTTTIVLTCELWDRIQSLMNAIKYGCNENEIQRQLGMLAQVYSEDFDNDR